MSVNPFIIVAIDGGAASGKSSTSRALSERFNLLHADTGSYYRAITAEMLRRGASPGDIGSVRSALADLRLGTRIEGRSAEIEISGRATGDDIRSREVNDAVSHFAAIPRGKPVGRRTANARHRTRPGGAVADHSAGRTIRGARAGDRQGSDGRAGVAARQGRDDHRRAPRGNGAADRRPHLCAGQRSGRV